MKPLRIPALALALSLALASAVTGTERTEDLATVYQRALHADPRMQQAEALHLATRETRTQAWLAMLPLDASASKNWTGVGSDHTSNPAIGTVALQVNLFSWNNWVNLKQANAIVAQGEANYVAAQYDLIARVAQQYFGVLSAQDTLAAQESALQSVARQLEQAERRYEVGLIAITDVQIARASRDSSAAAVIAARRQLASAQEQLRAITGEKYASLATPREDMPLLTPEPTSEDAWVAAAMDQNANLNAARMAAEISRDNYLAAWGGHLPAINVSASRSWDLENNDTATTPPIGTTSNTDDIVWQIGVSVPIFSAGATHSRVRQARYNYQAAKSALDVVSRQTEQQSRDAYQGVISQIAQVQALRQAVESNRVSLAATEAGYEVGTKTAVDVLTARQLLVAAQTSYAQAKYGYLNNVVALRQAAGNLDRKTIDEINGWLAPPSAPSPTPVPGPTPAPATPADPTTNAVPSLQN
ncbi:MAG: TolC family outer membrane protein [Gammaproteobacteria bacterium]|nr:TolC family outer membrane protein [Gammaproteobacteria bacterium]